MGLTNNIRSQCVFWLALIFLLLVTCWLYWPGLQSPSLLDDAPNLRALNAINENSGYWVDVVWGNHAGLFGRPVSMFSFASEKLLGVTALSDIKFNNLMLHLLCGGMVIWFSYRLFRLKFSESPLIASLIVGALWLLTPFFVSTVLYTVQRMAQLATLFVLCSLLIYCVGREKLIKSNRGWLVLLAVPVSSILAILSKENGALVFPLLTLVEVFFFKFRAATEISKKILTGGFVGAWALALIATLIVILVRAEILLGGYENREFSLCQRLLTESQILWEYVYHLLWPSIEGLGIYHDDYPITRGISESLSSLLAVLSWIVIASIVLYSAIKDKFYYIGFGLGFYLFAHLMESSFISLELYFEHRNYLPAFGIYFALTGVLYQFTYRYKFLRPWVLVGLAALIVSFGVQTGLQSFIWSNKVTLLMHAHNDHPQSARVNAEMARMYAQMGDLEHAKNYSDEIRKINSADSAGHDIREIILYCVAKRPLSGSKLISLLGKIESLGSVRSNDNLQILIENIINDRCPKLDVVEFADIFAQKYLGPDRTKSTNKVYGLLATLENYLDRHGNANEYVGYWLEREPEAIKPLLMRVYFATLLNFGEQRAESINRLLKLKEYGKLTAEQRDDLNLFLSPADAQ